jgi:hypothetical protein
MHVPTGEGQFFLDNSMKMRYNFALFTKNFSMFIFRSQKPGTVYAETDRGPWHHGKIKERWKFDASKELLLDWPQWAGCIIHGH